MAEKKELNPYIRCEAEDNSHVNVYMNGNDKVLVAMASTIIFDLANTLGEDLEKFAYKLADMTVEVAKNLKIEEINNENPVF